MKKDVFYFYKDEAVSGDAFLAVEIAMRDRTEARDEDGKKIKDHKLDDRDVQYAKSNFQVIIKHWRPDLKKHEQKEIESHE
jgi:hypothetical protein